MAMFEIAINSQQITKYQYTAFYLTENGSSYSDNFITYAIAARCFLKIST